MAIDIEQSSVKPTFDRADVEKRVRGMFTRNRPISSVIAHEVDGQRLTITFTNKNADGSNQTVTISFSSDAAAKAGGNFATSLLNEHHQMDRSMYQGPLDVVWVGQKPVA